MLNVRIAVNPHWYSQFWIMQFWQLWRQGAIRLRPLLSKKNPYASFYFEINKQPCLIDIHDKKEPWLDPTDYAVYFKANYDATRVYPANVVPCWNGTTLKRVNKPLPRKTVRRYDLVCITSITGGLHHKIALLEALAALPIRKRLIVKLCTAEQKTTWGDHLQRCGIEVIDVTWPYKTWLHVNKEARWCVLTRGKHDCLSFKMLDYMSIGAAVLADYEPTSMWPYRIVPGMHYVNIGLTPFSGDEMEKPNLDHLRHEYKQKVNNVLPQLQDNKLRENIAFNNYDYFSRYIASGQAARYVVKVAAQRLATKITMTKADAVIS